jgi:hypothetical protein
VKSIAQLDDTQVGGDIYIVGTGPSLRVFPVDFLRDKFVIGLNRAWTCGKVDLSITIHPDLNLPADFVSSGNGMQWVVPREKSKSLLDKKTYSALTQCAYEFRYDLQPDTSEQTDPSNAGRVKEIVQLKKENYLYLWSSIAQSALHLAARMGARNIFLIGCDNSPIGSNDHAKAQHTRWNGSEAAYRYRQYSEGMSEVRNELYKIGVHTFNLSSILGVGHAEEEFERLCRLKGKQMTQVSQPLRENQLIKKIRRKLQL